MVEHRMPEVQFRRELRQNYLMIAAEEELEQKFEARMLAGNTIDGLLKFRVRREDDRIWFCYEITSRQPLSRLLERTGITAPQIRRLLLGIAQTLTRMEDYLLNEALVLLDPDFIYMDSVEFQPGLCLVPGREGDFPEEFSNFLQFLLGKTDHQDKEAVMLIYGLYQESLKDNYGLNDLLRWLMKEDYSDLEYAYMSEDGEAGSSDRDIPVNVNLGMAGGAYAEEETKTALQRQRFKPGIKPGWFICWAFLPVLAAAGLWMWRGMAGIVRYGAVVIGGAAALAVAGFAVSVIRRIVKPLVEDSHRTPPGELRPETGRQDSAKESWRKSEAGFRNRSKRDPPQPQSWEMVFEEQESDQEPREQPLSDRESGELHLREPPRPQPDDITHTVVLRPAAAKTSLRRLNGIEGTVETIQLSYYPFLIGKQESLADYILKEDTISRLHARVDRRDDTYWLTDLNSTNGTMVNGHALEANETVPLHAGDRVDLADLHFKFE